MYEWGWNKLEHSAWKLSSCSFVGLCIHVTVSSITLLYVLLRSYLLLWLWNHQSSVCYGKSSFCIQKVRVLKIIQGPPKKCIHTLTDGICVLFSKLNWIIITICSMVFSQHVATRMTVTHASTDVELQRHFQTWYTTLKWTFLPQTSTVLRPSSFTIIRHTSHDLSHASSDICW
jgi:hypothetical protein